MTTNPEQADTVPPLSDDDIAQVRKYASGDWRKTMLDLCDTIDSLRADLATARRQRDEARANHQSALDEQGRLERELLRVRRQRDERPAGRVVLRQVTCSISSLDPPDVSRVTGGFVDAPVGTEVAVVVLADDSDQAPPREPRGIEPEESFTVQARVTSIEHPIPGRRDVADDSGEGE